MGPRQYTICRCSWLVKAELLRKVTMEEVKGMQRDLVVQLWSNHGCVRPALQVGLRRHRHLN